MTTLQRFLDYNLWANARLSENIASVPSSSIEQLPLAPFGSIHETLRHVIGAENIWLDRIMGQSPTNFLAITEGRTLDELREMLVDISGRWVEYASAGSETANIFSVDGVITYSTTKGDVFEQAIPDVVLHMVNHSTYHRGQVMSALRSVYDGRLSALDLIVFTRE
ncbi:MAG TPA: DinB family protein [Candidatus Didemnitutus sp.]|nr:DinB family protein [Candidatus Didemnitutus sp.]